MPTKLTQALARQLVQESPPGTIVYDQEVSGMRMVVGRKSSSWKLVGRVNDRSGLYVTLTLGRVEEMTLKTARSQAIELAATATARSRPCCAMPAGRSTTSGSSGSGGARG